MRTTPRAATGGGRRRRPAPATHHPRSDIDPGLLDCFRGLCHDLPGSVETLTFGHPTFQAGPRRTYAVLDDHERRGSLCLVVKLDPAQQAALVDDDRYFPSKFGARHGWTAVLVDGSTDWRRLVELVVSSFRRVAPVRLVAELDSGRGSSGR